MISMMPLVSDAGFVENMSGCIRSRVEYFTAPAHCGVEADAAALASDLWLRYLRAEL